MKEILCSLVVPGYLSFEVLLSAPNIVFYGMFELKEPLLIPSYSRVLRTCNLCMDATDSVRKPYCLKKKVALFIPGGVNV